MPENSTSFVMRNIQSSRSRMKSTLGNLYRLRTWVEYGFRQSKQELGWTNYRFTDFQEINKWWEIIFSAYWMVSSSSTVLCNLNQVFESVVDFTFHPQWSDKQGWKTTLNNFRLIIQPLILFWMITPWLEIFFNRS